MKKIIFLIFLLFLGGCVATPPARIPVEIPQEKTVVIVPRGVSPSSGRVNKDREVYPDPTRGIIDNLSREVIKVWFDRKAGQPNLILQSGMSSGDIYLPPGVHRVYIERWMHTYYGLRFRRETVVRIEIGEFSPRRGENYGWTIRVHPDYVTTPWGGYYDY